MHTYTSFFSVPNTPKWRRLNLFFFPLYKPRRKNPVIRGTSPISWQNDKAWIFFHMSTLNTHTHEWIGNFWHNSTTFLLFLPVWTIKQKRDFEIGGFDRPQREREILLSTHTFVPRSSVIDFTSQQSRLNMHRVPVTSNHRVLGILNGQREVTHLNRRATWTRVLYGYKVAQTGSQPSPKDPLTE